MFLDHDAALSAAAMPGDALKELVPLLMLLADDPYAGTHPIEVAGPEHERMAVGDAAIVTFVISESSSEINVLSVLWLS